jgi:outer membrane receptor protein involved in Fe transport
MFDRRCSEFFLVLVGSLSLSVSTAWAGVQGSIFGSVVDEQEIAVPQAHVQLLNSEGKVIRETDTSVTGNYEFLEVPMGDYQVSVQAPDLRPYRYSAHVSSAPGIPTQVRLSSASGSPAPTDQELVLQVKAKKKLIQSSSSTSRTELQQEQIKKLPQGSEASLSKLISSTTPGVVQGPFGQMFVRGSHANIQYQIDGVQMPESPSNSFGPAFSPRNFERMEIITGGIPAEYGQRLGAVLNIVTKSGPEVPSGEVELNYGSYNTFSPHLLYGGSNESGNVHYYFGLNYNRTDRGLDTPQPESQNNQFQGGRDSIHNHSHGDSEFAKVDWQVNNSNKLSFVLFHSYSFFEIPNYPSSFQPTDPFFQSDFPNVFTQNQSGGHDHSGHSDHSDHSGHDHSHSHDHDHDHDHDHSDSHSHTHSHSGGRWNGENQHSGQDGSMFNYVPSNTNDTQFERNAYVQTIWKHTLSEKSFLQVAPYYKYSQIVVTNDPVNDLATAAGGATPITGATPTSFSQNRHINNLGLKADYSHRIHDQHLLKTGIQTQISESSGRLSIQRSLLENPYSDSTNGTGYYEGIYLQDDYYLTRSLILNAGLRFDAVQFKFDDASSRDSLLQPRIGLNYMLTDTTKLHVFYGRLFQPASLENLRKTFNQVQPDPTPYDIKAQKDHYYEVGLAQQFLGTQLVNFNLFYKDSENVIDEKALLRTSLVQPFNFAVGYAYGAEVGLRGKVTEDWSEYANYSYTIAKGKGISGGIWTGEAPDNTEYQFLDHVQLHTANLGVTYEKNNFWWTGQSVFGSGLRTGPDNNVSLPSHLTFDTTVGYSFTGKSWLTRFRLSGDVLNILDNRYPITIANTYNNSNYAAGRQFFLRLTKEI